MKTYLFALSLFGVISQGMAEIKDPVVMVINGKDVTASEFAYSYNKNNEIQDPVSKVSLDEYIDMFVNYKLKVEAALSARLDTASSYKREFETYRNMQLYPSLVDSAYIDSVAHAFYQERKKNLQGKDLLLVSNIFVKVSQRASHKVKEQAKAKIDSIYNLLKNGADFAEVAKNISEDYASAQKGGLLPWIGPNQALKEFEDKAYTLKPGEMSEPFSSMAGYHIILMKERKQLEPFTKVKEEILNILNRQGIKERSCEHRINQIIKASGDKKTREDVLNDFEQKMIANNLSLKYLIKEYHDGLLLVEMSKKAVWDEAATDTMGLIEFFKKHKSEYKWNSKRFKGFVYHTSTKELLPKVKDFLENCDVRHLRHTIKEKFNKDSLCVRVDYGIYKKGDNAYVDEYKFNEGEARKSKRFPYIKFLGKMQKAPKTWDDDKTQVIGDYQRKKEKEWVKELRKKYSFKVYKNVLKKYIK